jgi:hypothetical protein
MFSRDFRVSRHSSRDISRDSSSCAEKKILEIETIKNATSIASRQEFERQIFSRVQFATIKRLSHYTYTSAMDNALTPEQYSLYLNCMSHITPEDETKLKNITHEMKKGRKKLQFQPRTQLQPLDAARGDTTQFDLI